MPEEKILVTDIVKEVGNKALTLVTCEPFIQWVLEKVPIVIEHDISAILLADSGRVIFYQWLNQPLDPDCLNEFKNRVIGSLNTTLKTDLSGQKVEPVFFNSLQPLPQNRDTKDTIASFYCAPLVVRENVRGVFAVGSRKPDLFLAYRVNMFNILAGQVALAIDSLLAREQVVKQARIIERDSVNMKTAFGGMSEGLVMTDEKDELLLLNPAARKMLGLKDQMPQEALNASIISMLSPVLQELSSNDKRLVSSEIDIEIPQKMALRIDAAPANDSKGARIGAVIILRDITKEKEIDRMKTEFISTVSHELRTPLTTIRESVSQILDGILGPTTPDQREFLTMCLEDIDRLTRIINDLLDISKIEAKKVEIKPDTVDITALVKGVAFLFAPRFREKGLQIKSSFSKEPIEAYADKDKIIQVFTNLVGNAAKFTEKGYVEMSVIDKDDFVECSVYDTGRGIAEDDLPKVFSKFQQFGRTDGPGEKGTGLGLSIAKGIVELHHGKIWIESKFGEWTKFTFTLPKKGA